MRSGPAVAWRDDGREALHTARPPQAARGSLVLAVGAVLGLVALPGSAQGQARPEKAAAAVPSKVRALAIQRVPLADERLPDGGLIVALVRASLAKSGPDAAALSQVDVRWTAGAPTVTLLTDPLIDLTLPLNAADCERPNDLAQTSAVLCDHAIYSDPIFRAVIGLFTLADSVFKFDTDESIYGKSICLAQDQDQSALNGEGRNWASDRRVVVLRQPTLTDCVAAVQARKADAFVATDLEGQHLLGRLGLKTQFAMAERPLATLGLHAVASIENDRAPDLIQALNRGLEQLKQSEAYTAIVEKHLMRRMDALPGATAAVAPAMPPPPAKATAPVTLPADRERAVRLLQKGDEELAEGRVGAARQLYERAADMGLAQAAMALAATYDAAELTGPNLRNVQPDAGQARRWYERARALGASDADQRLARLGAK
jgi:hypothetical protein